MKTCNPRGYVLDTGALMQAESDPNGMVWGLCRLENRAGRPPVLPATVLAQVWRGDPGQVLLARVVKLCEPGDIHKIVDAVGGRVPLVTV